MSDNMQVIELITIATEHLKKRGFENPRLEVERMLGFVIDCSRVELYLNFERPISTGERFEFRELFKRRLTYEPLQHILGVSEFKEITVKTDKRALIPRPETELLVDIAVKFLNDRESPYIADIGTGSGVIALSIAYEILSSHVVAVDISDEALSLARENACLIGVENRVCFVHGDMLDGLKDMEAFDAVLSNPPYIKTGYITALQPEVRDFDPFIALDGGNDGLKYLVLLAENTDRYLKSGGIVLLECGENQAPKINGIFERTGCYSSIEIIKDFSKNNRIVKAVKK
ncbi:peptide chain release factor N(5)-glutamine methyltransferase [Candidatus Latescibacterota bacterium]